MGVLLEDLWESNKEARFEVLSGREEWGSEATWNLQSCVIVQVGKVYVAELHGKVLFFLSVNPSNTAYQDFRQ